MYDSLWKASARWGYAAVCQPLPASIYDKKHITRTLNETIINLHTSAGIRRIAVRLMLALSDIYIERNEYFQHNKSPGSKRNESGLLLGNMASDTSCRIYSLF